MNSLINEVLSRDEFRSKPPVCVDLGASGGLPAAWTDIAKYSVGIAFDADNRNFSVEDGLNKEWRRLVKFSRLVADKSNENSPFYLTQSPGCSSSLEPDNAALQPWEFSRWFEVIKMVELPAISLNQALQEADIDYIDWFKSDTQGTDLRLFAALPENIRKNISVVEFEPGIINAYKGEDKLYHILQFMDPLPFFVSDMKVLGAKRLSAVSGSTLRSSQINGELSLKISPGWVEMAYLNDLTNHNHSLRDLLLVWVFSTIKEQYGHALFAARMGIERHGDPLFKRCENASIAALRRVHYKAFGVRSFASFAFKTMLRRANDIFRTSRA